MSVEVARRVWRSPTAHTWLSLSTKSASLVLVLPQVLRNFAEAEAAAWFVFSSVIAVQGVIGFGFAPSFGRMLAYARAGAVPEKMIDLRDGCAIAEQTGINWDSIDRLCSCMRRVFLTLTLISFILLVTLGSLAVRRTIEAMGEQAGAAWIAWSIIVAGSSIAFFATYYVSYLQGMDRVTEWRRHETVMSLGSIFSSFIVLAVGGGLLALVISNQVWGALTALMYRRLCQRIYEGRFRHLGRRAFEPEVFTLVWQSAWKLGVTNVLSYGLVQSTGVIQSQFGSPATTATYNFTLRVVTVVSQVVQAPFLTKLPELARLRASGDLDGQLRLIRRGMRLTHWSTTTAVTLATLMMPISLRIIGSRSVVFDPLLWALFGLTIFLDRHGGMLNQIRNLTNQPLEHVGIAGYFLLNVSLMVMLHGSLGIYTFPVAMLGTQILFSLWFAAYSAYPVITRRPLQFESTVSIPPFLVLATASAIVLIVHSRSLY